MFQLMRGTWIYQDLTSMKSKAGGAEPGQFVLVETGESPFGLTVRMCTE